MASCYYKRVELTYDSLKKKPTIEKWRFYEGEDEDAQALDYIEYLNNDNKGYRWWSKIIGYKILE